MIDREKVIKRLEKAVEVFDRRMFGPYDVWMDVTKDALALLKAQEPRVMTLEEANDADVVRVVRCKDCRYGEPEENTSHEAMVMCQNKQNPVGYDDWIVAPDWYCADGERRDDND